MRQLPPNIHHGLGVGEVEVGRLVEEEVGLGRSACGSEGRRCVRKIEVEEDGGSARGRQRRIARAGRVRSFAS